MKSEKSQKKKKKTRKNAKSKLALTRMIIKN